MDMWIKQCDRGVLSCYIAQVRGIKIIQMRNLTLTSSQLSSQGFYDEQDPVFRGCAGNYFPHDEKCATQQQVRTRNTRCAPNSEY